MVLTFRAPAFAFTFGLMVAAALAAPPARAADALTCHTIPADASHASLQKLFGAANVATDTVEGAEGAEVQTTVLFPKDRAKRLIVFWKDETARKGISSLILRTAPGAEPTGWSIAGLTLKSTLADVEAANGKPFTLSGFGWDYGGFVTRWEGGRLQSAEKGCTIQVRFEPGPGAAEAALAKVSGDGSFSSALPAMRAVKPRIVDLSLGFN